MATPFRLIVGLGNPGPNYAATRHNAGFWLVEALAEREGLGLSADRKCHGKTARWRREGVDAHLLCPTTYMNHSGRAVSACARFHRIDPGAILVVHDEIDLPAGSVRLKRGGGHGGHNGLRDIIAALGSRDFARIRIGVGHPGASREVIRYVLNGPSKAERAAIDAGIDELLGLLPALASGDWDRAQQLLHTQPRGE